MTRDDIDRVVDQLAAEGMAASTRRAMCEVQRGELEAVHVNRGKRKGLRIKVPGDAPGLFATTR